MSSSSLNLTTCVLLIVSKSWVITRKWKDAVWLPGHESNYKSTLKCVQLRETLRAYVDSVPYGRARAALYYLVQLCEGTVLGLYMNFK